MLCYGHFQGVENNACMSKTPVNIAKEISGLSGEDLADRMGISAPHLSRMNTGKSPTTTEHIKKLAEICDVTEQEFYGLLAGDSSVSDRAARAVVGKNADEPLLIKSSIMDPSLEAAREIDRQYTNGKARSENFKVLLKAIYDFLEAENYGQ